MIRHLTDLQLNILRRSRDGLRTWESGAALAALQDELHALLQLGLLDYDESSGYRLAPQGHACLTRLDR